MMIVDWAAPFSLSAAFEHEHGTIKAEAEATEDAMKFLNAAFERPYLVGVFICKLIGTHDNDTRFFSERARRSYLRMDGTFYEKRSPRLKETNVALLRKLYEAAR